MNTSKRQLRELRCRRGNCDAAVSMLLLLAASAPVGLPLVGCESLGRWPRLSSGRPQSPALQDCSCHVSAHQVGGLLSVCPREQASRACSLLRAAVVREPVVICQRTILAGGVEGSKGGKTSSKIRARAEMLRKLRTSRCCELWIKNALRDCESDIHSACHGGYEVH